MARIVLHVRGDPVIQLVSDAIVVPEEPWPEYEGNYSITPSLYEQVLPTGGTRLTEDVTVEGVPWAETDNGSGGRTVTIMS